MEINTSPRVGSPFRVKLAVGTSSGVSRAFSICQTSEALGLDAVLLDPEAAQSNGAFEFSTCVLVTIALVETEQSKCTYRMLWLVLNHRVYHAVM